MPSPLDHAESAVILNKKTTSDGMGGWTVAWVESDPFPALISFDNSMAAKVAGKQGVTSLYSIILPKTIPLTEFEIIKRVSDEKIFRLTSDPNDQKTPEDSKGLDYKVVSAEVYTLPKD